MKQINKRSEDGMEWNTQQQQPNALEQEEKKFIKGIKLRLIYFWILMLVVALRFNWITRDTDKTRCDEKKRTTWFSSAPPFIYSVKWLLIHLLPEELSGPFISSTVVRVDFFRTEWASERARVGGRWINLLIE